MLELLKNILRYRFFWLIAIAALLLYNDYKTISSFVFICSILDLSIVQELAKDNTKYSDSKDEEE
tara:strand:+ start:470 stop:664 length:195 start_codon:yes stop_codon:yes gene_type:complete